GKDHDTIPVGILGLRQVGGVDLAYPTDPDNNYVVVNGVNTPYGLPGANGAADNGLRHPFELSVKGNARIYHLNRANGHIDFDQLVVHTLHPLSLPDYGYESPLGPPAGNYPTLEPTVLATTGLINPDAILGAVQMGETTAVVYVAKTLDGDLSFPT